MNHNIVISLKNYLINNINICNYKTNVNCKPKHFYNTS